MKPKHKQLICYQRKPQDLIYDEIIDKLISNTRSD